MEAFGNEDVNENENRDEAIDAIKEIAVGVVAQYAMLVETENYEGIKQFSEDIDKKVTENPLVGAMVLKMVVHMCADLGNTLINLENKKGD